MARKRQHTPLRVLMNNRLIGYFSKEAGGAVEFRYDESWLDWESAIPVSLSLPLREDAYRGAPVLAVFENLLPDSDALRRRVAGKVGAEGTDVYSLLAKIGRDCAGALQFLPEDTDLGAGDTTRIDGIPVNDQEIEDLLKNLVQAPLGLDRDEDFRISVAGAQEKTALLWHEGRWLKPRGTTPTTHLLKTQMGTLPNGLDLSLSVENEYYCLKLVGAFGLPVNAAEIRAFGQTKALVVERFDRRSTRDGRLLRLPQEDFCQALSVPPTLKFAGVEDGRLCEPPTTQYPPISRSRGRGKPALLNGPAEILGSQRLPRPRIPRRPIADRHLTSKNDRRVPCAAGGR